MRAETYDTSTDETFYLQIQEKPSESEVPKRGEFTSGALYIGRRTSTE